MTFAASLLGLIAVVFLSSGCDETRRSALQQTAMRLPGQIRPQQVAIAGDGSVWAADESHGVVRRNARGQVRSYDLASDEWEDDWASDIVRGPDGAIWFATTSTVGRIDHSGRLRKWRLPRGPRSRAPPRRGTVQSGSPATVLPGASGG